MCSSPVHITLDDYNALQLYVYVKIVNFFPLTNEMLTLATSVQGSEKFYHLCTTIS